MRQTPNTFGFHAGGMIAAASPSVYGATASMYNKDVTAAPIAFQFMLVTSLNFIA